MAQTTNLDAHIRREDFLTTSGPEAGKDGKGGASATDLTPGESFSRTLRKPDFQRDTSAWSPEAVRDCIVGFANGDLIPAVICWQSQIGLTFVIDGAHRISALIAWITDDYGDGKLSRPFYGNHIPAAQLKSAKRTRAMVDEAIGGPYKNIKEETREQGSFPDLANLARVLGNREIKLQWVPTIEPKKAEAAFFKINRSAVIIDPTELRILKQRFTPGAVVARTIRSNATGYNYLAGFQEKSSDTIRANAITSNELLYSPPLADTVTTTELPLAGPGYGTQTLPLIFDLVNIANDLQIIDPSKSKSLGSIPNTEQVAVNEDETVRFSVKTRQLIQRLTGKDPSSLALHPAVYFYSANGRHQPTAVLAVGDLIRQLVKADRLIEFSDHRASFEQYLLDHKGFINQLTTKYGSMSKGYKKMRDYLLTVLSLFVAGMTTDEVTAALTKGEFDFLFIQKPTLTEQPKDFSKSAKQFKFLAEAMSPQRSMICRYCKARLDIKAMTLDHVTDKKDKGLATVENATFTHPYCNSTYKDSLRSRGLL
jgi:hypothetical protein